MISVLIATRNRPKLLVNLLNNINSQSVKPNLIVVVDSSDSNHQVRNLASIKKNLNIKYLNTDIRSAAIQRNIGLDLIPINTKFIFVLDDDVIVERDYIEQIIKNFTDKSIVGISGVSRNNKAISKNQFSNLVRRIFFLYSNKMGKVTLGGINIPFIEKFSSELQRSDWLIGCAAWRFSAIKNRRYKKFLGQSLFEDVIFSIEMSKVGQLVVDPKIIFEHKESELERPNYHDFYVMWIHNRYFVIKEMMGSSIKYLAFHWTNLGKLLQISTEIIMFRRQGLIKLSGFIDGYIKLLKTIKLKNEY